MSDYITWIGVKTIMNKNIIDRTFQSLGRSWIDGN